MARQQHTGRSPQSSQAHLTTRSSFDPEAATITCLSVEKHEGDAISDHTKHYFGCIPIAERARYFEDIENNPIWQYELETERKLLVSSQPGSDGASLDDAAKRRRDKKIQSVAVAIEAQYRRTEILRQALSINETGNTSQGSDRSAATATSSDSAVGVAKSTWSTEKGNLIVNVNGSREKWQSSGQYKEGIVEVRKWRANLVPQRTPGPPRGQSDFTDALVRPAELVLAVSGPSVNNTTTQPGRERVRTIVKGARKLTIDPPLNEPDEYILERDVNAYLIQYTGVADSESGRGIQHPNTKKTSDVPYLHPTDEELTDPRFKGRFPDQRMAMNVLLGTIPKKDSHGPHNDESDLNDNIMSESKCKAKDDSRIRYFHIPSNNMSWVEKAIARYFDEDPEDLCGTNKEHPVRTHTQMLLQPQFWRGQQHGGRSGIVHARHMRPMCERISSAVDEIEDNPKNIVLFMPYVHWETDRMRTTMAKTIDTKCETERRKNEQAGLAKRNKRQQERQHLLKVPRTVTHEDEVEPSHGLPDCLPQNGSADNGVNDFSELMDRFVQVRRKGHTIPNHGTGRLGVTHPLGQYLMDAARLYEAMSTFRDRMMVEEFLYKDPPLHPRRTLDQSYYWTLKTTKGRDRDQVVSRGTNMNLEHCHRLEKVDEPKAEGWLAPLLSRLSINRQPQPESHSRTKDGKWRWTHHHKVTDERGCEHCRSDIQKISQLIMVDQLWMWVLDERTIVTSFPKRYGTNKQDLSGVHKSIRRRLKSARKNQIRSVYDLALIILDECSNTFFDRTKTEDRQPPVMDIFSESIGKVTNQHTISFQHVWHWTQKASNTYRSKSRLVGSSDLHVPLLDINPEGKLQREVKDIIDELDIMINIHKKQREVIRRFCKHVEHILDPDGRWIDKSGLEPDALDRRKSPTGEKDDPANGSEFKKRRDQLFWFRMQSHELLAELDDRLDELDGLKQAAEGTAKSINDLLSLKQQQASVVQAWESVKQAEEAVRQGRAIMMFTVITIIFLPLSFISSVFGMNNINFPQDGEKAWTVRDQLKWILITSFTFILCAVVVAYSTFIRSLSWSLSYYLGNLVVVKLGLYGAWVRMSALLRGTDKFDNPDSSSSAAIMRRAEEAVFRMKDDVRQANKVRQVRRRREEERKEGEEELGRQSNRQKKRRGWWRSHKDKAQSKKGAAETGGSNGAAVGDASSAKGAPGAGTGKHGLEKDGPYRPWPRKNSRRKGKTSLQRTARDTAGGNSNGTRATRPGSSSGPSPLTPKSNPSALHHEGSSTG